MTDRPAPPYRHAAVLRAALHVTPANGDVPYDHRLNGCPVGPPWRDVYPLPMRDPDVGVELRRAALEVVR